MFLRILLSSNRKFSKVVILDGVRTPIGSFRSALNGVFPQKLAELTLKEAIKRSGIKNNMVDHVYVGQVLSSGLGQFPGRQAVINAGLSSSTECTMVNKMCASGMKAIQLAAQAISLNQNDIAIATGMESMSCAPFTLQRDVPSYGGQLINDTITNDGLICAFNKIHMGNCTEKLAKSMKITREEQDEFAINSYKKSQNSWKIGVFDNEVIPVNITLHKGKNIVLNDDEEYKRIVFEKVSSLKPAFQNDGTITAANASKLNDGAASIVLSSLDYAEKHHLKPQAQILGYADASCDPIDFGIAPSLAIPKALKMASINQNDVALWEINEAFSAVVLANIKILKLDPSKVNIDGGAVSLGHPVGMSGTRILLHLVKRLTTNQIGVAAICNGGGGASSIIIKKL